MTTVLADTSVWVAGLRDRESWVRDRITADAPIAWTEPVLMEVLSGTRSDREREATRQFLARGPLLPFSTVTDFEGAAEVYRVARSRGLTSSSHVDCMIIAVALRTDATLVTLDRQQAVIAEIFGVEVGDATAP